MVESQNQSAGLEVRESPSLLLLEATQGGVVNNADIAVRLARLLFASSDLPEDLPLEVKDLADKWSIRRERPQSTDHIEIRKRDASIIVWADSGRESMVLRSAEIVQRFGQIIIENARSAEELHRQLPLRVEDKGETWLVAGSGKANPREGGPSGCHLEMRKRDACVVDFWFGWTLGTHPAIRDPS
jgi:hypothetical protein